MAPVFSSSAVTQPRTPSSPPLLPIRTLPFTTTGAIVIVSPLLISPSLVCQSSLPVLASIATVWLSSVFRNTFPLSNASPRLTTSQHTTPTTNKTNHNTKNQNNTPKDTTNANTRFGYGPA